MYENIFTNYKSIETMYFGDLYTPINKRYYLVMNNEKF